MIIGALIVFCVNVIAAVVAALRGVASGRRERAFWRAYDDRCAANNRAAGLSMKGHGT